MSVIVLCFVVRYFMSILVLQSSWWGWELVALFNLSSWCLVMVERLFLTVPWGCLQFVIVVLPDHTHLLFLVSCHFINRACSTTHSTLVARFSSSSVNPYHWAWKSKSLKLKLKWMGVSMARIYGVSQNIPLSVLPYGSLWSYKTWLDENQCADFQVIANLGCPACLRHCRKVNSCFWSIWQLFFKTFQFQGRRRIFKSGPMEEAIECRRHERGESTRGGDIPPLFRGGGLGASPPHPRINFWILSSSLCVSNGVLCIWDQISVVLVTIFC